MRTRLRHIAHVNPLSRRFDRLADDDLVTFLPMENVWPGDKLDLSQSRQKSAVATGYTRFECGDVVVPKITPTFEASRSVLIPDIPHSVGTGTTELHVVRPGPEIDPRYLLYIFHSHDFLKLGAAEMYGVAGQKRVPDDLIRDWTVDLPSLDEQRRIADFLDAETARIDHLMSAQLRVLELLEERANSRILEIIGESVIAREDGTPVVPMRRVIAKLDRPTLPTDEVITAFRDGQVTARGMRRADGYTMAAGTEPQGQGVQEGDIVIHGLDGFAGAIGDSEAAGNCSPAYHVCLPTDGGSPAFYGRLLRLLALGDYLALFGASARERAVDFRNWKIFGHAPIPAVDPALQREIGSLITKSRPLRVEVNRFNTLLAERRQALISAAVTGGIIV